MKSIAYVRWSSDEQTAGNSLERQTENVEAYCQRTGLEITDTLVDDGYSAFKGNHITKGELGRFLASADKGKYRGFALVVEQMDRLSRQGIEETFFLTRRILNAGVEIHVTQQNRVIHSLDDLPTVILHAVESYSAQEYSRKLKERVGRAWHAKKHKGESGVSITNKLPGWLDGKAGQRITVNEKRVNVVRQIFEMAAQGMGKRLIGRRLNEQKVPTFSGRGPKDAGRWIPSYIDKILHNRAVLGEYQPRKGGKPDGEVRIDFYPAVITPDLWQRAHEAIASRRTTTDNGDVTGRFAGRTGKCLNLFGGLVFDASMGGLPMHYSDKGKRDRPRLVTACKEISSTRPNTLVYADFERLFLRFLDQLDWTEILDVAESTELLQAEEEVGRLGLEIERTEQTIQKLVDALIDTPSKALKERLIAAETQLETDKASKIAAETKLEELRKKNRDLLDDSVVYSRLLESRDFETRTRLRDEIRRKVSKIRISFGGGNLNFIASVCFVNGVFRQILVYKNGGVMFVKPDQWEVSPDEPSDEE